MSKKHKLYHLCVKFNFGKYVANNFVDENERYHASDYEDHCLLWVWHYLVWNIEKDNNAEFKTGPGIIFTSDLKILLV